VVASGRVVWLAAIAVVAAAYTWMAFGMEWETAAGRIGPGFFPRIIGGLTVALCLIAIARDLRRPAAVESEGPRHGRLVAIAAAGLLGYAVVFEYLGAALASVAFMLFLLSVINRGRTVANVALAVLVPAALYLLFEIGLGAGLPPGPLPAL
jgi:putative tricarboxylic transport membrane protein